MHTNLHKNQDRLENQRAARRTRSLQQPVERDDYGLDEEDFADVGPGMRRTLQDLARGARGDSNDE